MWGIDSRGSDFLGGGGVSQLFLFIFYYLGRHVVFLGEGNVFFNIYILIIILFLILWKFLWKFLF